MRQEKKNIKRKILKLRSWHIQWPVSKFNEKKIFCWELRAGGRQRTKLRKKKRLSGWLRWAVTMSALVWSACSDDEWIWGQLGRRKAGGEGRSAEQEHEELLQVVAGDGLRPPKVAGSHLDLENLSRTADLLLCTDFKAQKPLGQGDRTSQLSKHSCRCPNFPSKSSSSFC